MARPDISHNILVVEDEWLIALDIQTMIEEHGHRVIGPAGDVATALSLIEANQIDAALLDINLGAENSFPIADKLEALAVPAAFVSAYVKKDIPSEYHHFDVLPKPLPPQLLSRQLHRMLAQRQK